MTANVNKIKQYRSLRLICTNQAREIKEFASRARDDTSCRLQFKMLCQHLESIREEFKKNHLSLMALTSLTDDDQSSDEAERREFEFNLSFIEAVSHNLFDLNDPSYHDRSTTTRNNSSNVKLPKVEIPKFTGDIRTFKPFLDMFESLIHQNDELSNIEKFNYLVSSLRSPPLTLVQTTPMTNDNYDTAFKALLERYDNGRLIAFAHLQEIDNARPVTNPKNIRSLRSLLDTFSENLAALKNMKFPVDHWDFMLYYMFSKRLDQETITCFELEEKLASNATPTFQSLKTFVLKRCNALDAIEFSLSNPSFPSHGKSPKNFSKPMKPSATFFTNLQASFTCAFCKRDHSIYKCADYFNKPPHDRFNFVKQNKLCTNCLSSQHPVNKCKSTVTCRFCNARHHSSVHTNKMSLSGTENSNPAAYATDARKENELIASTSQNNTCLVGMTSSPDSVLLATAVVEVLDVRNNFQKVRILLDTGSQASYISQKCFNKLGLPRFKYSLTIHGLGSMSQSTSNGGVTCKLKPVGNREPIITIDAIILPKLCSDLPNIYIDNTNWAHTKTLNLADKNFNIPAAVDMIIGAQVCAHILKPEYILGESTSPVAINTIFGYVLMGGVYFENKQSPRSNAFLSSFEYDGTILDENIKRFWELEEIPKVCPMSPEEIQAERIFSKTHCRDETGRFVVNLPFKMSEPKFNFNDVRSIALRRFYSLERRLLKNPHLYEQYSSILKEYLQFDYLEKISVSQKSQNVFYLPHHAVLKNCNTENIRIVYDAGARDSQGISLNDTLLVGPKLQKDITTILLNFRIHSVVFTADLCKMFLQILVSDKHRDYQRILWRFHPNDEIEDFRFKRLVFGLSASPYLANETILQIAQDERKKFPLAAKVLENDIYVDDIVTGCSSLKEALEIRDQLIGILKNAQFELRKWTSNCSTFLKDLLDAHLCAQGISFDAESESTVKILGMKWQPSSDMFYYTIDCDIRGCTKRAILSDIARIFDPLGFLTPLTVYAKLFMQRLWSLGIQWDESPPEELCEKWFRYKSELSSLSNLQIPRRLLFDDYQNIEIHAFSDASERAYACVIYFRVQSADNFQKVYFVCAKSKVAPLKTISLPRLELCAAVLLSNLISSVLASYENRLKFSKIFAYTDSSIVLSWIKSSPHRWKSFVSNRVTHIQNRVSPSNWFHISSENNIADCATRGLFPSEIIEYKDWFDGPAWLLLESHRWPIKTNEVTCTSASDFPELCSEARKLTLTAFNSNNFIDTIINKWSSLPKIKRIFSYVLRFIHNCRYLKEKKIGAFTIFDLNKSLYLIVKAVQQSHFAEDFSNLEKCKPASKPFRKLNVFIDEERLLRVGGRIKNSCLTYDRKHPIILPRKSRITDLITEDFHIVYLHPGVQTLHFLLAQHFWILSSKRAIRGVISNCQKCWKLSPKPYQPPMGNLPALRVSQIKAFSCVGLDYIGPFNITMGRLRGAKVFKGYICLFVCFSTKAIHLELASDLTTDAFIAALRRFIARRGRCSTINCDCGSNFIGANNQILELFKHASDCEGIEFKFHPAGSPHFSGLAEAGVKSVKTHMYRVVGLQIMTYEEFYTLLTQIEALLNSRPLYPMSTDPSDLSVITPGHFLTLEPLCSLPDPNLDHLKLNKLNRYQLIQRFHQEIWKRWKNEYLHTLQQRGKWLDAIPPVSLDTMVLIKNETTPPLKWPLGRIDKLYHGEDGVARVADVRTKQGILKRALVKLCPLPMPNISN